MADKDMQPVDRIQTAMHGTPQLHPDEQNKYLGTFRERVEVAVTVYQIKRHHYVDQLNVAFTMHPDYRLYINGNLDQDILGPYLQAAAKADIQFTIKTDDIYRTGDANYALVFTADQAINQEVIDIDHRYQPESKQQAHPKEGHGLFGKLKKLF
ncbi:YueI family protein [Lactiplantibacillus sp. WILCCON 0030]|uniref:YueI family protein n=1 Tax=Lactiplantibacillus brownii TaxID=3069269 RepID=A0ABU1A9Z4_9LACO|nr:YueI family protein [Lactiplantibacillus brownii]MDQ7937793.1 YueI family protein [Lactiplantibacillus brownii]